MAKQKKVKKISSKGSKKKIWTKLPFPDKKGNVLIAEHTDESIILSFKVKTENRTRHIGHIDKASRKLYVFRNRSTHLHRKSDSYGFMYKLFKETRRFDTVYLSDEFSAYEFPRSIVLEQGKPMHFVGSDDNNDYELQYFLPLNIIEKYQVQGEF